MTTKIVTKRKRVGRYSNEVRSQAGIEYAVCGSLAQVSRSTGIPEPTLGMWNRNGVWDELIKEVQAAKASEHRAKYSQIIDIAQDVTLAKLPEATAAQAHLIACQGTDKVRLADNMPTTITSTSKSMQSMTERFEKIEREYQAGRARIVSEQ